MQIGGSFARTSLPQAITSATHDAANELLQWGPDTLSYDANSNLSRLGATVYSWNARDELTGITGSLAASFQYDPIGRRVSKSINGGATAFRYDGFNSTQELIGGTPTANLLPGLEIDEYFLRTEAAGLRSLLSDGLGSTLALADGGGSILTEYTFDPFGRSTATGLSIANPTQYAARENDDTGLYYYRARYYSPLLQRFISDDPIGFAGGEPNLYSYVRNNPVVRTDPLGLWGVTARANRSW